MLQTVEAWTDVMSADELFSKEKAVIKRNGKQILLWRDGEVVRACNNRCPHEGFPLSEGTVTDGCVLTCNWHNWKFDLDSGETLVGGDALRRYPARIAEGRVLLDLTDPPAEEIREKALAGIREGLIEHNYERIARELVRFERAGGDPAEVLTFAFNWARDAYEFGMTHAQAAAPDWLVLRDRLPKDQPSERMIALMEILGHLAWDARMQPGPFPYPDGVAEAFDAEALEDAVEREDQTEAVAQLRACLRDHGPAELRPALERIALKHYQNFGHTPIYLEKTYELIARLGKPAWEALLLPLVRTLCTGAREDLIPEFRAYAPTLTQWNEKGGKAPRPEDFRGAGVPQCLKLISAAGPGNEHYRTLLQAGAEAMLYFNIDIASHIDRPVQENVEWLDFTHTITHLNASRKICENQPDLWANAMLQTGCFLGRNATYVDWNQDVSRWRVADVEDFFRQTYDNLLDHGETLYIYSAHMLKLTKALEEEVERDRDAQWVPVAMAALNRFLHEPVKRKHMRRVARQALNFVTAQG